MIGRQKLAMASMRVGVQGAGVETACPNLESPSITIIASNQNNATIFFGPKAFANGTDRRVNQIPLTAGQAFTFTGTPIGNMGFRNVSIASPGDTLYFGANATPQWAIIATYNMQSA